MAMTKKERAEYDAAILRAETLAALRWTQPVERDVMPPEKYTDPVSVGWDYNLARLLTYRQAVWGGSCVFEAWSTSNGHGEGKHKGIGWEGSQDKIALFSTKKLALLALRHDLEKYAAEKLHQIDKAIAECDAEVKEAK